MLRTALALLLTAATIAAPSPSSAEIYSLHIGIDDYDHLPQLDGAVNDALDVTDALISMGATVTTLLDRDASRERIFGEWRRIAARVGPGDLFIITYAGHGSNEPEYWSGNEYDGRDETLLLSGFANAGPDARHRIRDDEIADLLTLTPPSQTIFVGDACHSGTLSRSITPILGYRYVSGGDIIDDPLPPPPPKRLANEGRGDLGLFLAAVDETQKVPEFLIEGKPRGALSYAFASAMRGAADTNRDQRLTAGEIETHVRRIVRSISRGLQRPEISSVSSTDAVLVSLDSTSSTRTASDTMSGVWDVPFDTLPELALQGQGYNADVPNGARMVSTDAPAELMLDIESGQLISDAGDVISYLDGTGILDDEALAGAIDKARLAEHLMAASRLSALDIHFGEGDRTYRDGNPIRVEVTGRSQPHLTIFNIGSNGQVANLYPLPDDPLSVAPGRFSLDLVIAPPFGADHVVAIETTSPPEKLRALLKEYDGSTDMREFWSAFRRLAEAEGDGIRLATFPFFTAE